MVTFPRSGHHAPFLLSRGGILRTVETVFARTRSRFDAKRSVSEVYICRQFIRQFYPSIRSDICK